MVVFTQRHLPPAVGQSSGANSEANIWAIDMAPSSSVLLLNGGGIYRDIQNTGLVGRNPFRCDFEYMLIQLYGARATKLMKEISPSIQINRQ